MAKKGLLIAFESSSKGGKTTLSTKLAERLQNSLNGRHVMWSRAALTESTFSSAVKQRGVEGLEYSTAFYWADLVFHNKDLVEPCISAGGILIHDRYDISILAYREAYGLMDDDLLLDGYRERGMLREPDLTVFLNPPTAVMLSRIAHAADSSSIDRALLGTPEKIDHIQARTEHHIARLQRTSLVLDTDALTIEQCLKQIELTVLAML